MSTISEAPLPITEVEHQGHYEVVGGQVVEKPPMNAYETDVACALFEIMAPFTRSRRLGRVFAEMLFRIDPETGLDRRPDLAFVSQARWPLGRCAPTTPAWEVVPDLAIEVISPTNRANEVLEKVRDYFRTGVRMVWVVYPLFGEVQVFHAATTMRALRLETGDVLDGGDVVPGFSIALGEFLGRSDAEPECPEGQAP